MLLVQECIAAAYLCSELFFLKEQAAVAYLCSEYSERFFLKEHTAVPYLCSEYSELNYALVLLLSHSLRGQLQPANQIDLPPLLDFRVFSEEGEKNDNRKIG